MIVGASLPTMRAKPPPSKCASGEPTMELLCPDCGGTRWSRQGALPDVAFFAGKALAAPLPGGDLLHCRACDLRLRWPRLPDYGALYDNAGVEAWRAGPLRKDQSLVHAIVDAHAAPCRLLDFGCYNGSFLARLPARVEKFGVEIASAAAAMAREQAGAQVAATLHDLPADLRFDFIVTMDVIEHVQSPRALIAQLAARLAPGGQLIVTTGDGGNLLWRMVGARWWYCYYPEHISFVSARWVRFHVPGLGLHIRGIETFNYLDAPAEGRATRWRAWAKFMLRPRHHARKRALHLARHGWDAGVPGIGLTRDHLLLRLSR